MYQVFNTSIQISEEANVLKVFTRLSKGQAIFILLWCVVILVLGITAGTSIIKRERGNLEKSIRDHKARIDPNLTEDGKTQPETNPPAGHENDRPEKVKIGVYVDRIVALSMKDSSWTVDFYIWFKWTNDDLKPGEAFQVVGGEIQKSSLEDEKVINGEHYAMYRVIAKITKAFNTSRFPRDDHLLTIHIEDAHHPFYQVEYIADTENSTYSSRVAIPGYTIYDQSTVVKLHSYKTNRGDPALPAGYKDTYSQFIYGLWIKRPTWGLHIKMFLTLFAAVLIPMFGFFTNPNHRLGVVVGSFFASVASTYISSAVVPDAGIATLADVISGIGIVTIAIVMIQTIIAQYFFEKPKEVNYPDNKQAYLAEKQRQENFTDAYDYATFVVLLGLYIWLNIAIPAAASITPEILAAVKP